MDLLGNFNESKVKNIFVITKKLLVENKTKFENALNRDSKYYFNDIEFENIIKIIDSYIEKNKFIVQANNGKIVTGYGNIACIYNENPYITVHLICTMLRTNNDICLYLKGNMQKTNNLIAQLFNRAITKESYRAKLNIVNIKTLADFQAYEKNHNALVFIGTEVDYIYLKKRLGMLPIIFISNGIINIYCDNKEFKNELMDIEKFAFRNDYIVNYYNNNIEEDINNINSNIGLTSTCIIFTKDKNKVKTFVENVNCSKIYINKNPFENYMFEVNEEDLVIRKKSYVDITIKI